MQLHTVGIDLGKTFFHLVGLNLRGEVVVRKKFSRKQLLQEPEALPVHYINSSMNAWVTSGGICASLCTSGPAFTTGSAPCRGGTSWRSQNLPIGISSRQSKDLSK